MAVHTRPRIDAFRQVLVRHALPGVALALLCLGSEPARAAGVRSLRYLEQSPGRAASIAILILMGMVLISALGRAGLGLRQWAWLGYLLMVSIAEEWVFRLALPLALMPEIGLLPAIVVSNVSFGVMHHFTLGWSMGRCLGVVIGSFGFSLLMWRGGLLVVIAAHWVGTFFNTPAPPGARATNVVRSAASS